MKAEILKKIEEIGKSWIGTPYFHMAKTKKGGADCALFLACVIQEAGILQKVEDLYYSRTWMITGQQELMVEGFERHLTQYIAPGFGFEKFEFSGKDDFEKFGFQKCDILCFTTPGSKVCHHAAMYFDVEEDLILHSYQRKGVCIVQFNYVWKDRLRYVLRIIEK